MSERISDPDLVKLAQMIADPERYFLEARARRLEEAKVVVAAELERRRKARYKG